jgi:Mrp family chromosome partitioning ATPase
MKLRKEDAAPTPEPVSLRGSTEAVPLRSAAERENERERLFELVASRAMRLALLPVAERLLALPPGSAFCIASAQPGEGRTLVAATLGLMLSEKTNKNVLIVDAHLDRPCLDRLFAVESLPGLAGYLREKGNLREAVGLVGTLSVLPAGRHEGRDRPFRTAAAKRLLDEIRKTYDIALFDLPPLTSSRGDAAALCDWADGTIMVVRANATRAGEVAKALETIDSHKLVGVILNQEQDELPRWLQRLL